MNAPADLTLQDRAMRAFAMSEAWDRAADALKRRDYASFDKHMATFNALPRERGGGNISAND